MNFQDRCHAIFITTHREISDSFHGYNQMNVVLVHEMLDALKIKLMHAAADYDMALEAREDKKRSLSGAKEMPTSSREKSDAHKARIQANMARGKLSE